MITVNYRGQTGNCLFQYCYGRIVAELTGQSFRAPGIKLFPQLETAIDGIDYGHGEITIQHTSSHHVLMSPEETAKRIEGFDARLEGYFERAEWYLPYREKIRRWFPASETHNGSFGIHVRGTDGEWNSPTLDYYLNATIKAGVGAEDCDLFTDDPNCTISKMLLKRGAHMFNNRTPEDDFWWMTKSDTLIISNSTFAWWAAFLSNASRIIQPEPTEGFRSEVMPNSYLKVPDWEQVQY